MAKKKINLKKGSKINELFINSPEYRQLYESGTLASVDKEGLPNMYYPEVEVVGDAPLKLRKKRQLANAEYTNEEWERYMYQGKKPERDKDFSLLPGDRLNIYNAVLPFEYPNKELPKALKRYITGEERKFLGQESIKEEDRDLGKTDEDAWAHFMGVPQLYNTVNKSEYSPKDSKNKNAEYYSIKKGYPDFDELLLENAHNWFQRKENIDATTLRGVGSPFMPLENVTYSKGQDEKGKYYSMYDIYDFNVPGQKGIGKPYEVYDRVYYDDTNSDKPVVLKKSYGGKINNMKKKNNLPKLAFGAPQLFDLAANTLTNLTTYAVTNMIKAIREPKEEIRPTKRNTGFVMENGGVLSNDPTKPPTFSWATGQPVQPTTMAGGYNTPSAHLPSKKSVTGKAYLDFIKSQKIYDGRQFPDVEVNARNSDENFKKAKKLNKNQKDTKQDNGIKNYLNYLSSLGIETGVDQIPGVGVAKGIYNTLTGRPFTGMLDFIKTPSPFLGDLALNALQDNPTEYSTQSFEDNVLPEIQFAIKNKNLTKKIGMELYNKKDKKLPGIGIAAGDFSKKYNIPKKEFLEFLELTENAKQKGKGRSYEESLKAFKKKKEYDIESQRLLNESEFVKNEEEFAMGGMIKRADGSYSKRGLWDNIRDNAGSGKKPTKQMLKQEKKIKQKMAMGGMIDPSMYMQQMMYGSYAQGGEIPNPVDPVDPVYNYAWGTGSYPVLTKDIKSSELSSISRTTPSITKSTNTVKTKPIDVTPHINPVDSYTDKYKNKPLGAQAFPFKYTAESMIDDGYGFGHNNLWMSKNLGLDEYKKSKKQDLTSVTGHLDYLMNNYDENKNIIPTIYLLKKNLSLPNQKKYTKDSVADYNPNVNYFNNEKNYINNNIKSKGFTYKDISGDNSLIQSFTPDLDTLLGSVTLTPEMWKFVYDSKSDEEAKTKLFKLANVSPDEEKNFNNTFFHMNLNNPKQLDAYKKVKSKLPQTNWDDSILNPTEYNKAYGGAIKSYFNGGQVPQNIPVEVEGGEAYELPNGEMGEFEGPSHDNGGIPVALPEQTKVYSKQLKVNGKTMADRKTKREANVAKLEKILSKNPSDKFIKEALKRQQETAALEEQSDMAMQEQANQQQQMQQQAQQGMMQEQAMAGMMQDPAMMQQIGMMMYGGKLNKLANGSPGIGGEPIKPLPMKQIYDLRYPNKTIDVPYNEKLTGVYNNNPVTQEMFSLNNDIPNVTDTNPSFFTEEQFNQLTNPQINPLDIREKKGGVNVKSTPEMNPVTSGQLPTYPLAMGVDPISDMLQQTMMKGIPKPPDPMAGKYPLKKQNKFMNFLNEAADKTGDFFSGLFDKSGKPKKGETKSTGDLPFTRGDLMGMVGTKFGAFAPMATTMLNRMMTPKNQNFFREYGAEGLRAMQEAQGLSTINRDKQLADIKLGEEASRQKGRNSARGVNTLRAMDISSDIAANQAQNQAYNSYAQQMMQMLGQKGQMENQQDQMVMQGETQRDLADRQDVDNFYTNLATNFASQSELMQKQGRDMNQAQYNKMILEMSPLFSKYGIGVEMRNGKVVMVKDGKTMDETTAQLTAQKIAEEEKKKAGTTTGTAEKKKSIVPAFSLNYGQD